MTKSDGMTSSVFQWNSNAVMSVQRRSLWPPEQNFYFSNTVLTVAKVASVSLSRRTRKTVWRRHPNALGESKSVYGELT